MKWPVVIFESPRKSTNVHKHICIVCNLHIRPALFNEKQEHRKRMTMRLTTGTMFQFFFHVSIQSMWVFSFDYRVKKVKRVQETKTDWSKTKSLRISGAEERLIKENDCVRLWKSANWLWVTYIIAAHSRNFNSFSVVHTNRRTIACAICADIYVLYNLYIRLG